MALGLRIKGDVIGGAWASHDGAYEKEDAENGDASGGHGMEFEWKGEDDDCVREVLQGMWDASRGNIGHDLGFCHNVMPESAKMSKLC